MKWEKWYLSVSLQLKKKNEWMECLAVCLSSPQKIIVWRSEAQNPVYVVSSSEVVGICASVSMSEFLALLYAD